MQSTTGFPGDIALAVNSAVPESSSVMTTEPDANEFDGLTVVSEKAACERVTIKMVSISSATAIAMTRVSSMTSL